MMTIASATIASAGFVDTEQELKRMYYTDCVRTKEVDPMQHEHRKPT